MPAQATIELEKKDHEVTHIDTAQSIYACFSRLAALTHSTGISSTKKIFGGNTCLFENCAKRTFRHIAGVIGEGGIAAGPWVEPDLVRSRGLPVKSETRFLEPLDDLSILEAGKAAHQPLTTSG